MNPYTICHRFLTWTMGQIFWYCIQIYASAARKKREAYTKNVRYRPVQVNLQFSFWDSHSEKWQISLLRSVYKCTEPHPDTSLAT